MTAPNSPAPPPSEARKLPRADRLLEAAEKAGLVAPARPRRRDGGGPSRAGADQAGDPGRCALPGGGDDRARSSSTGSRPPPGDRSGRSINATGVVVHTNLGRAPLSEETIDAMRRAAAGYTNLEYDLEAGERGDRYGHAEAPLCRLTGAEAAVVVNNNAAAVMLALAALMTPRGRPAKPLPEGTPEVVVSRGQLVEIGGGFRIPDVLRRSGAALVEVGTTNRTYRRDYEDAIGPRTRILMSVHRSNFRAAGLRARRVARGSRRRSGERRDLWVVDDLGSGTLLETAPLRPRRRADGPGARPRRAPTSSASPATSCSARRRPGILAGRREAIRRVKRHPLMRALRVDKVTLAGLCATLAHYERGEALAQGPGVARDLAPAPDGAPRARARWRAALGDAGAGCAVLPSRSAVGGGSLPEVTLPTFVLALPRRRSRRAPRAAPPRATRRSWRGSRRTAWCSIRARCMPGEDEALVRGVREAFAAGGPSTSLDR